MGALSLTLGVDAFSLADAVDSPRETRRSFHRSVEMVRLASVVGPLQVTTISTLMESRV